METRRAGGPRRSAPGLRAAPSSSSAAVKLGDRIVGGGPVVSLEAGDRVTHSKFGLGTVVSTSGIGDKADATIDFAPREPRDCCCATRRWRSCKERVVG